MNNLTFSVSLVLLEAFQNGCIFHLALCVSQCLLLCHDEFVMVSFLSSCLGSFSSERSTSCQVIFEVFFEFLKWLNGLNAAGTAMSPFFVVLQWSSMFPSLRYFVELCDTEVCFLHILLVGTNLREPNTHKRLQKSLSLETTLIYNAVPCFPHGNFDGSHVCNGCWKFVWPNVGHKLESILWLSGRVYWLLGLLTGSLAPFWGAPWGDHLSTRLAIGQASPITGPNASRTPFQCQRSRTATLEPGGAGGDNLALNVGLTVYNSKGVRLGRWPSL